MVRDVLHNEQLEKASLAEDRSEPDHAEDPSVREFIPIELRDPGVLANPLDNPNSMVSQALARMTVKQKYESEKEMGLDAEFNKAIHKALDELHLLNQRSRKDQICRALSAAHIMKDAILLHVRDLDSRKRLLTSRATSLESHEISYGNCERGVDDEEGDRPASEWQADSRSDSPAICDFGDHDVESPKRVRRRGERHGKCVRAVLTRSERPVGGVGLASNRADDLNEEFIPDTDIGEAGPFPAWVDSLASSTALWSRQRFLARRRSPVDRSMRDGTRDGGVTVRRGGRKGIYRESSPGDLILRKGNSNSIEVSTLIPRSQLPTSYIRSSEGFEESFAVFIETMVRAHVENGFDLRSVRAYNDDYWEHTAKVLGRVQAALVNFKPAYLWRPETVSMLRASPILEWDVSTGGGSFVGCGICLRRRIRSTRRTVLRGPVYEPWRFWPKKMDYRIVGLYRVTEVEGCGPIRIHIVLDNANELKKGPDSTAEYVADKYCHWCTLAYYELFHFTLLTANAIRKRLCEEFDLREVTLPPVPVRDDGEFKTEVERLQDYFIKITAQNKKFVRELLNRLEMNLRVLSRFVGLQWAEDSENAAIKLPVCACSKDHTDFAAHLTAEDNQYFMNVLEKDYFVARES